MNEKCPCCATQLIKTHFGGEVEVMACAANESCWFRCNASDLPRIAAAMELAKLTATWQETMPASFRDHIRKELKRAKHRVLEVFGGGE